MKNIKGAIFDVDGTLLDSMPTWDSVAEDFLKSRGVTPKPDLNDGMRKLGGHQIPAYFQAEYGLRESEQEIQAGIRALLAEFYFHRAELKDGAVQVLETLLGHGVKMCVATATERELVEPALRRCGVLPYFGRVFTCPEERTHKSEPDIYLRAADFLGTNVRDTLVFEDALYAIRTAKNAGFPVVAVYDLSAKVREDEIRGLCDVYLETLSDFLA